MATGEAGELSWFPSTMKAKLHFFNFATPFELELVATTRWRESRRAARGAPGRTRGEHTADVVACIGRGGHHVIREASSEFDLHSRRGLRLCVSHMRVSHSRHMLRVQGLQFVPYARVICPPTSVEHRGRLGRIIAGERRGAGPRGAGSSCTRTPWMTFVAG